MLRLLAPFASQPQVANELLEQLRNPATPAAAKLTVVEEVQLSRRNSIESRKSSEAFTELLDRMIADASTPADLAAACRSARDRIRGDSPAYRLTRDIEGLRLGGLKAKADGKLTDEIKALVEQDLRLRVQQAQEQQRHGLLTIEEVAEFRKTVEHLRTELGLPRSSQPATAPK